MSARSSLISNTMSDKLKGGPWDMSVEAWKGYMRGFGEGPDFPSRDWTARHLEEIGAQSVLDVGCGGGIEYEALMKRGVTVDYCGIDYAPNAIQACQELFPDADFRVGDARDLEFGAESFDVVIVRHCLEHVDDWRKVIFEAQRVAKKSVVLVLWVEPVFAETDVQPRGGDAFYVKFNKKDLLDEIIKYGDTLQEVRIQGNVPGREHRIDTIFQFNKV